MCDDAAGRRTETKTGTLTTTNAYDSVGNMLQKTVNKQKLAMTYDAANELKTMTGNGGKIDYSYDANGNLTQKTMAAYTDTYAYNVKNQLTSYKGYDGYQQRYTYNAQGHMVKRESKGSASRQTLEAIATGEDESNAATSKDGGSDDDPDPYANAGSSDTWSTTTYVYDVTAPYYEVLSETTDGVTAAYEYGMERISAYEKIGWSTLKMDYVYDGRGSVAQELTYNDSWYTFGGFLSTKGLNSYTYTPFGELLAGEGSGYRFNGEYYDSATGMVNLRARQYEPAVMRFSQRDLLKGDLSAPLSLNRYLYCLNEPVGYYDRSGNRVDEDAGRPKKVKPGTASGQTGVINFKTAAQLQIEKLVQDRAAAAKKTPITIVSGILSNATNAMSYIEKKWPMHEATVKYVQEQNRGSVINRNETKLPGCGRNGGTGYPDVTQFPTVPDVVKGSQVWEVKPDTPYGWRTGKIQIENYTKSGLVPGRAISGAIPYSDGKLVIRSGSALSGDEGVVYYTFVKDPQTEPVVVGEPERATQTEQAPIPTSERILNNAKIFVNGLAVAVLIADDSTVVGVIDDVLIPFLTVEIIKLTNTVAPAY